MDKKAFNKQKRMLRSYWKQIKAGMIKLEDVPQPYRDLLVRYYNV